MIQCRLKIASLLEVRGTYEPISYCWKTYIHKHWLGVTYKEKKDQKTFQICIDKADFYITESLQSALQQIRLVTEIRVLWADSVCINQSDDNEKSVQVAMMGEIYQSGKQTLAWLGNANYWTGRAFKILSVAMCKDSEDSESNELSRDVIDKPNQSSQDTGAKPCLRHLRYLWSLWQTGLRSQAYCSISCRPYFERAWIVQEVVLSNNVVVMCGKYNLNITGEDLYQAFDKLAQKNPGLVPEAYWIKRSFGDLWDNLELYCLPEMICKLLHTKASDQRDKLYSTLGLHQNCLNCGSMAIDYTKDVDEVFLNATKLLLSRSPFLDLLSISYGTNRPDGKHVPSWVWNPEPRSVRIHLSQLQRNVPRPFQASQGWHSQPQFRGRILGLLGYVIDSVKATGEAWPADPGYMTPNSMLEMVWCYLSWVDVSEMYEPGITDSEQERRINAFRCTLKPFKETYDMSRMWYSNWNDEQDKEEFDLFHTGIWKRFRKFFYPGAKKLSTLAILRFWAAATSLVVYQNTRGTSSSSWSRFGNGHPNLRECFDRRFVKTRGGCYGLCHRDTMPNDRLVLLQGANVPIVLRPSGERWLLVGECYLYGAMYGELWDQDRCQMLWIE